ncbi:VPLPA-CTERM sorting domain-containing protein [Marinovum sp.]|uniref:VPLPA-CTERM sorting domain-containing protein n=1 Tax=Marinovum sp. TaxID=2024839 RepID=UPI003A8E38A7
MGFNLQKTLSALVVAAITVLTSSAASAVTVNFGTFVTGDNLGNTTLATLDAVQNGTNVDFTLNATFNAQPTSYVDYLRLNYTGALPSISASNVSGVSYNSFSVGTANDASLPFNIKVDWPNSNAGGSGASRLNPGELSSFTISNVSLGLFDFGTSKSLIHVNGLAGGGSTKYTGAISTGTIVSPVPVPASLPLLLGGLGIFAGMRWRRRNS